MTLYVEYYYVLHTTNKCGKFPIKWYVIPPKWKFSIKNSAYLKVYSPNLGIKQCNSMNNDTAMFYIISKFLQCR